MSINLQDLRRVIPEQWKIQSKSKDGKKATIVAYIDARDVMKLLDEVVGPENWQDEYQALDPQCSSVKCRLMLKVSPGAGLPEEWVAKEDIGTASEYEGEKGAFSDAFKRAAVKWGIGRFLYDLEILTVPLDTYGNLMDEYGKRIYDLTAYVHERQKAKAENRVETFAEQVKKVEEGLIQQRGVICNQCSHLMKERIGSRGPFLGCSNYPTCRNTLPMTVLEQKPEPAKQEMSSTKEKIVSKLVAKKSA